MRRVSVFCLAALALAAPLGAQPYGIGEPSYWTFVDKATPASDSKLTGGYSTYVHVTRRDSATGKVTVDSVTVFEEVQKAHPRGPFWQMTTETLFDCRARTFTVNWLSFYDKPAAGAKAKLLWTDQIPEAERAVKPIRPDSAAEDTIKIICQ